MGRHHVVAWRPEVLDQRVGEPLQHVVEQPVLAAQAIEQRLDVARSTGQAAQPPSYLDEQLLTAEPRCRSPQLFVQQQLHPGAVQRGSLSDGQARRPAVGVRQPRALLAGRLAERVVGRQALDLKGIVCC